MTTMKTMTTMMTVTENDDDDDSTQRHMPYRVGLSVMTINNIYKT